MVRAMEEWRVSRKDDDGYESVDKAGTRQVRPIEVWGLWGGLVKGREGHTEVDRTCEVW